MPGRNGTGPMGAGAITGRGLGSCVGAGNFAKGAGLGLSLERGKACRHGFGRSFRRFFPREKLTAENHREILRSQKAALKNWLAAIDKQLESL